MKVPTHATTDATRVVKYAQNDIVPVKGRPTDASEMAKRWFKSQNSTGPSHKAPGRLGSSGLSLLSAPGKWGKKKEKNSCLTYMLSGIASD
jgi:hypothetical protein